MKRRPSVVASEVVVGSEFALDHVVGEEDVAFTQRSGGVKTLSTSKISELVEECCISALARTAPDVPTAGCAVNMRHVSPMPVGSKITVTCTVASTIRRQITFKFEVVDAYDAGFQVASGTHLRAFVDVEAMRSALAAKRQPRELAAGMSGQATHLVDDRHVGGERDMGGQVQALKTSSLMTWVEEAAIAATEEFLPEGCTTVGAQTTVAHVAPTPKGVQVTCRATLSRVEETSTGRRRLLFDVSAEDRAQPVMTGTHVRFLVDRDGFERRAAGIRMPGGKRRGSTSDDPDMIKAMEEALAQATSEMLDIDAV